ncbi:MAG: hypothetical protein QNK70_09410 [Crocinitomicaceae bacterium]|tara:strand:- start:1816 stop:1950 length:135 start_codon:yes stop_codon:yes gene_type:complete
MNEVMAIPIARAVKTKTKGAVLISMASEVSFMFSVSNMMIAFNA